MLQKTKEFQRAIFFALLNPQPDGACFATMKKDAFFDFSDYFGIEIQYRSQSLNMQKWKITLETSQSSDRFSTYEHQFEVEFRIFVYTAVLLIGYFISIYLDMGH